MNDRDQTQLLHMSEKVEFIIRAVAGVSKDEFLENEILQHAICMAVLTIGECANHLSDEFIEEFPEIPWLQIIGIRNVIAHGYRLLEMGQIWEAVAMDIPQLREFLLKFV